MTPIEIARRWRDAGYRVLPLKPDSKAPALTGHQRTDTDVDAFWSAHPDTPVGVVCNGVVCIDVDVKHGPAPMAWVHDNEPRLPATLQEQTPSGGLHIIYAIPPGAAIPNDTKGRQIMLGIDIKSNGRDGDSPGVMRVYGTDNGLLVAPLPGWLADIICREPDAQGSLTPARETPPERLAAELERHCRAIRDSPIGEQQSDFTNAAYGVGALVRDGLDEIVARAALLKAGLAMENESGRAPWTANDLNKAIERKLTEGKQRPVYKPDPTTMRPADTSHLVGVLSMPPVAASTPWAPFEDMLRVLFSERDAAAFVCDRAADQLRFANDAQAWFVWRDAGWELDVNERHVSRIVERELHRVSLNDPAAGDKRGRALNEKLGRAGTIAAVRGLLARRDEVAVNIADFDGDHWLLGTPGGTVDLRTGVLRPAQRADMLTKRCAVTPADTADCPMWLAFLREACCGDEALMHFLRVWFGYSLTGSIREQRFVVFNGAGGDGKSVILSILSRMMDAHAVTASSSVFVTGGREEHLTSIARLKGARMLFASETDPHKRWNEATVKALSGGDKIVGHFMRKDMFEFEPECKMVFATNHLPRLENPDNAMRRRMLIVPFDNSRPLDQQDRLLPERLMTELPGILRWAIDGCLVWQREGLVVPPRVQATTDTYFGEADHLGTWIAEGCAVGPDQRQSVGELYSSYSGFIRTAGETPPTQNAFSRSLKARGFDPVRTSSQRMFNGIRAVSAGDRMPVGMGVPGEAKVIPFQPR